MDTVISAYQILNTMIKRIAQNPVYVGLWTKAICGLKAQAINTALFFLVYGDRISSLFSNFQFLVACYPLNFLFLIIRKVK